MQKPELDFLISTMHRDNQTYFAILLDDNNRKPICRLHFNGKKKYASFFDTGKEERVELADSGQLYEHASRIIGVLEQYEQAGVITEN